MTTKSLGDAASVLAAALARRIDITDADPAGVPLDRALRRRLLATYAEALQDLDPQETAAWLLGRLATIEARQLVLQAREWHGAVAGATPGATPGAEREEAGAPFLAPVVSEEILLPAIAVVLCDDRMVQQGFYKTEHLSTGDPFRWTGPDPRVTVHLPKLRPPFEVRLFLLRAFNPEVLDQARLSLDGGEWAPVQVESPERRPVLVGRPEPGGTGGAATMRLDIDTVRTDSPSSRGETDKRSLGFALLQVEIRTV